MPDYIKSPLNYTGGKYKLLPQILTLFPQDINMFVDLFCGACNVAVNVQARKIICNDSESHVINLMQTISKMNPDDVCNAIFKIIDKYNLSKTNKEGYLKCRDDYNKNPTWDMFYTLIAYSFNNQIRFNKNGEYNIPFGMNRSDFNKSLQDKMRVFVKILNEKDIVFTNNDFSLLNPSCLSVNDFVYCDPPYLITTATYNEQGGWTEQNDKDLMNLLDKLNESNIKFAMSNVLLHKGRTNDTLIEWSKKYNVHHLNTTYSNCSYHGDRGESDEVLITNY